jgi:mono/diheme cytochrome c family protein
MRLALMTGILVVSSLWAWAVPTRPPQPPQLSSKTAKSAMSDEDMQLEGEKRFRTNCGRCHQAPHKFPPRMMATIVRHMRVRSMITDDDMKYILRYMTQ